MILITKKSEIYHAVYLSLYSLQGIWLRRCYIKKAVVMGWRGGSLGKELASQALRPQFHPQNLEEMSGLVVPLLGKQRQEDPWSSLVSSRPKASIPKNTWGHLVALTRTHAHAKQKEPWQHQSKGAMVAECVPCLFLPFSYGNFLVCFLLLRSTATPKATWRRKESFGLSHSQSSSEDRAGTRDGNWIRGHGGHCLLACSAFLCKPVPITLGMTSFTVGLVPRHQLAIMKTPHKHSYTSVLHLIPDNQDEPSQGWN